ncbi:MAG: hypothetical protein IJ593_00065 [Lachnospiraceae bacterium]|nr:hypothetical protein [Lachnospiraceae bacterium]
MKIYDINEVSNMETSDIKALLTSINKQIKYVDSYSKKILKDIYKEHIEACENELLKRGVSYEVS